MSHFWSHASVDFTNISLFMLNTFFLETTVYVITQSKRGTRDFAMLFKRCTEDPCNVTVVRSDPTVRQPFL